MLQLWSQTRTPDDAGGMPRGRGAVRSGLERTLVIPLNDDVALAAGRLADRQALRGGDAVHLASFETLLARCDDDDVRFSCADDRLTRAARRLR